jgi:Tat protein translocase TatB subunit
LGFQELLLITAVVLLVFGPKRLPEVARTMGRCLSLLREATDDVKGTLMREVKDIETPPPSPPSPAKTLPDPASPSDAKERS